MIIDASVALKWSLPEADSHLAAQLFKQADLAAPSVLPIEVGYVLTKLVRRRAIVPTKAVEIWRDFQQADLTIIDSGPLLETALEWSLRLHVSFYDSVYLCLAVRDNDILITADERFVRAVRTAPELRDHIVSLAETAG